LENKIFLTKKEFEVTLSDSIDTVVVHHVKNFGITKRAAEEVPYPRGWEIN